LWIQLQLVVRDVNPGDACGTGYFTTHQGAPFVDAAVPHDEARLNCE
jgi:hypothetical protein